MFKTSLFTTIFVLITLTAYSFAVKPSLESLESLEKDCKNGITSKCVKAAQGILRTQRGEYGDNTAFEYFDRACEGGDMKGCDFLGRMYYSENHIVTSEKKSKASFKKACEGNYAIGCYHLGNFYNNGEEKDYNKSLSNLSKACKMDVFPACTRLGDMYFLGKGVPKDETKAEIFYKKNKQNYEYTQKKALRKTRRYNDNNSNTKKMFFEIRSKDFDVLKTQKGTFISPGSLTSTSAINRVPDCVDGYYIYQLDNLVYSYKSAYKLFFKSEKYQTMLWEIELENFENTDFTKWIKPTYTVKDKKITALDILNRREKGKNYSTHDAPMEIRYKIEYWHKPIKDYVYHEKIKNAKKIYVDFKKFQEGRFCSEVKFSCLPESKDTELLDKTLYDGLSTFKLAEEKYNDLITLSYINYDNYQKKKHPICENPPEIWLKRAEQDLVEKASKKRELIKIEKSIAKELPYFWGDTPKVVRYNWILKAMDVGEEFGYGKKGMMVGLCARIGINFYKDPKYKYITGFVGIRTRNISYASDYIDFTIFDKRYDSAGNRYTRYLFGDSLRYLPRIKNTTLPRLNDRFSWAWE